jgi:hypothetical protein
MQYLIIYYWITQSFDISNCHKFCYIRPNTITFFSLNHLHGHEKDTCYCAFSCLKINGMTRKNIQIYDWVFD